MRPEAPSVISRALLPWLGHATVALCASVLVGMVLASGQPIIPDDVWLHLGLGRVYAELGPVLEVDPFLHTAETAPPSHGWFADLLLDGVAQMTGFSGLRVFHTSITVLFLALAWWIVRRETGSAISATLAATALTLLSAYRLVQLRPQRFSMVAVLVLFAVFLRESAPIRAWKLVAVAVLSAVWANVHAAFLLGPLLSTAGAAGLFAAALLRRGTSGDSRG